MAARTPGARVKPYYDEDGITIYCGDARELLPHVRAEAIVTDPVWPNCEHIFPGVDALDLLRRALRAAKWAKRVVLHLGVMSDPRFLRAVPRRLRFLRCCYLEYAVPGYLGRILRDADVAYVFGEAPKSVEGARVLPGRIVATKREVVRSWGRHRAGANTAQRVAALEHPATRVLAHERWLVKWFGGASVCDPFMGTGTTLVAAKALGLPAVGIEIEERYCEMAVNRLRQRVLDLEEARA